MHAMKRLSLAELLRFALMASLLGTMLSACRKKPDDRTLQGECDRLFELQQAHDPNLQTFESPAGTNRYDWILGVTEQGYRDSGHTKGRWNDLALRALKAYVEYSRMGMTDASFAEMTNAVVKAVGAGCDDPFIRYMDFRYGLGRYPSSKEAAAVEYIDIFRKVYASRYHPLLKFIVGYRALDNANRTEPNGNRHAFLELLTSTLDDAVRDPNAPPDEIMDCVSLWADYSPAPGWIDFMIKNIEPILKKRWRDEESYCRVFGKIEVQRAWEARGSGYANTVTDQGWEKFRTHMTEANYLLGEAWRMNPSNASTAYQMMRLELGQGRGWPQMEQWLNRAMALNPGYYDAADLAALYLEPRWYGSEEEALEFARSCITSTKWVGTVPLVLPDIHHSLAAFYNKADSPEYWHRPSVWRDVHAAYEKFFELNPTLSDFHHNYARDAYLCGHYDVFLEQAKLFGDWTNHAYFGGKEKFDQMLATASASTH